MSGKHRLGMTIVCLRISTALYLLCAAGVVVFAALDGEKLDAVRVAIYGGLVLFCLAIAALPEIAIHGIRRRRFWGWALGVVLCGLYAFSIFLPLGAFGLWGLLDAGSRAEMGLEGTRQDSAG